MQQQHVGTQSARVFFGDRYLDLAGGRQIKRQEDDPRLGLVGQCTEIVLCSKPKALTSATLAFGYARYSI